MFAVIKNNIINKTSPLSDACMCNSNIMIDAKYNTVMLLMKNYKYTRFPLL